MIRRIAIIGWLMATAATTQASSAAGPILLNFRGGVEQVIVSQVIERAARRLADLGCQQVLADFTDAKGHTLMANLQTFGQPPAEYLMHLVFIDASDSRPCRTEKVGAFTVTGGKVVSVCATLFANRSFPLQGPTGELVIIHELLHTLGLGENPPTSAQINDQVRKRCT